MLSTLHADMAFARRFEHALVRVLSDYVDALADLQPEANASTMRIGDGCALYLGQGTPPGPNRVVGLGMHGPVRPEDLHQAVQFYLERDLPCVIAVNPLADASLIWELAARRYVVATFRNMLGRHLSPELAETLFQLRTALKFFLSQPLTPGHGPESSEAASPSVSSRRPQPQDSRRFIARIQCVTSPASTALRQVAEP